MAELAQNNYIDQIYVHSSSGSVTNNVDGTYTIKWQFSSNVRIGQFYDGSYWVCPIIPGQNITITNVSLQGSYAHVFDGGLEIDPNSISQQGFLNTLSIGGYTSTGYSAAKNLMTQLPYVVDTSSTKSIVKCVMDDVASTKFQGAQHIGVLAYFVLTVLPVPPADGVGGSNTIRPSFVAGVNSKRQFQLSEFNFSQIPSSSEIQSVRTNNPSYAGNVINALRWNNAFVDHFMTYIGGTTLGDSANFFTPTWLGGYSANDCEKLLSDMLVLCGTDSLESKIPSIVAIILRGKDLYFSHKNLGFSYGGAGQGLGRLPAIAWFGTFCTDQTIKDDVKVININDFQEGKQTFVLGYEKGGSNKVLWGDSLGNGKKGYWSDFFGAKNWNNCPEVGNGGTNNNSNKDPYGWVDGSAIKPGFAYMGCCSTGTFISYSVVCSLFKNLYYSLPVSNLIEFSHRILVDGTINSPDIIAPPSLREYTEDGDGNANTTTTNIWGDISVCFGTDWGDANLVDSNDTSQVVRKASTSSPGRFRDKSNVNAAFFAGHTWRISALANLFISAYGASRIKPVIALNAREITNQVVIIVPSSLVTIANGVVKALNTDESSSTSSWFIRGVSTSGIAPITHYVTSIPSTDRHTGVGIEAILKDALILKTVVAENYTKYSLGVAPLESEIQQLVDAFTSGTPTAWADSTKPLKQLLVEKNLKLI